LRILFAVITRAAHESFSIYVRYDTLHAWNLRISSVPDSTWKVAYPERFDLCPLCQGKHVFILVETCSDQFLMNFFGIAGKLIRKTGPPWQRKPLGRARGIHNFLQWGFFQHGQPLSLQLLAATFVCHRSLSPTQ
jgi:hypothetical protein